MNGITWCGPYKMIPVECSVVKEFRRSFKWVYSRNTQYPIPGYGVGRTAYDQFYADYVACAYTEGPYPAAFETWMSTPDYFDCVDEKCDNSFETVYGPFFSNSSVVYGLSSHNIAKALIRQTADHNPPGVNLPLNQTLFLQRRCARRWQTALSRHILNEHDKQPLSFEDEMILYAFDPTHGKYKLRAQAMLDFINLGDWSSRTWMRKNMIGKLKRFERAKHGKYPRLIGDLGTTASLVAGFATKFFKKCIASFLYSPVRRCTFIGTPSHDELKTGFKDVWNPVDTSGLVFSDDSCFSAVCSDGIFRANLDISSCDASHTGAMFKFMEDCIPITTMKNAFVVARRQLSCGQNNPFCILDANKRKAIKLVLSTHENNLYDVFLASGSTLTTAINTVANSLINLSLSRVNWRGVRLSDAVQVVKERAMDVGYNVTVDVCENLHDLQFLKHSPTEDYSPFLNLGVMLRTMGHCFGPLPGNGSFREKAFLFDSSLCEGFKYSGVSRFTRVMTEKYKYCEPRFNSEAARASYHSNQGVITMVSDDVVCSRYGITIDEWVELCSLYKVSSVGECIRCSASDKIFSKDYGYGDAEHTVYMPSDREKFDVNAPQLRKGRKGALIDDYYTYNKSSE